MKTLVQKPANSNLQFLCAMGVLLMLGIFANSANAQTQGRTITGVVSSLDGPLLGANIVLKGTTIGVISNESGSFTFPKKLQENDILVVSYLGYKTREVRVNKYTSFIEPFLEDIPVIIGGAFRTDKVATEIKQQ